MFIVTLNLNEKGKKVCGTSTKVLNFNGNTKPTIDQIQNLINTEFMPELVEEIQSVTESIASLVHQGDIVKVYENENNHWYARVSLINLSNSVKTSCIIVDSIDDYRSIRCNIFGKEIGGSRKFKRYIEIPTADELNYANEIINREDTYKTIAEMLGMEPMYESPEFLSVDDLVKIREILSNAKNKFAETL